MNIAYFSNQFAGPDGHGIRRYARQLFSALEKVRPDLKITPVAAWSRHEPEGKKRLQEKYGVRFLPWGRRWTPLAWTMLDWPPVERWVGDSVDLVHAVSLGYPIATRKPYVVTIHDIGPLSHPEFFTNTRPWVMEKSLKQAVKKADAFICVSQSTADELAAYAGGGIGSRIHVVHEGVASEFFDPADADCLARLADLPGCGTPFILMTGAISPRKNVARLIRAFAEIARDIPHHLVLAGGGGWQMDEVRKEMHRPALAGRIHMPGYVTDEQLRALYVQASLYVYPSLYEGFGLPVLEAMAAGCPVMSANIPSLSEVAGDAAVLVDPYNVDDMAETMRVVCTDTAQARDLAARGRARAPMFTWEACAGRVAQVYEGVV